MHAKVRHAHVRRRLHLHVPRPRPVLGHARDVRVPLLVVLDERLEVLAVREHVLHGRRAEGGVAGLAAVALVGERAEEAVPVGGDLADAHADVRELTTERLVVVAVVAAAALSDRRRG
eukprot:13980-Pelagococcus_subviridis.AAC.1